MTQEKLDLRARIYKRFGTMGDLAGVVEVVRAELDKAAEIADRYKLCLYRDDDRSCSGRQIAEEIRKLME